MSEIILKKADTRISFPSICTDENSVNSLKKTSRRSDDSTFTVWDAINGSTLDSMYKSCIDYSGRVWNVVRAELQDNNFTNK